MWRRGRRASAKKTISFPITFTVRKKKSFLLKINTNMHKIILLDNKNAYKKIYVKVRQ